MLIYKIAHAAKIIFSLAFFFSTPISMKSGVLILPVTMTMPSPIIFCQMSGYISKFYALGNVCSSTNLQLNYVVTSLTKEFI